MRLPEVQRQMLIVAGVLDDQSVIHNSMRLSDMADKLRELVAEIKRKKNQSSAPPKCQPVTPNIVIEIRRLHRQNPNWTQLQIANKLNVNQGRVSEALHGKRK